ncbi:nucleoside-triphosphatase THEP1 [Macrosteles quadrilineatus]|uniref:nucleoside-triphosphatase THEP1 n=1 Tax=Macrosteles quadrilineatus TaxID=74068 RepID=UPI0023E19BB8|nr:nucleoside-triphosphatase THEP1 [Macrosteles quadrilineatus]
MVTTHFFITGPPGIGKTTLVKKVCTSLKKQKIPCHGFYTEEVRVQGRRTGFDVVTLDDKRAVLARTDETTARSNMRVGQYAVDIKSFELTVLPILASKEDGVLVIDEIGRMELCSKRFGENVLRLFKDNRIVIATIPIRPLPFVSQLKSENPSAVVIEVNRINRNELELQLTKMVVDVLQ